MTISYIWLAKTLNKHLTADQLKLERKRLKFLFAVFLVVYGMRFLYFVIYGWYWKFICSLIVR